MAKSGDPSPKPSTPKARREAELAAALRANLRRRKAAASPAPKTEAKD